MASLGGALGQTAAYIGVYSRVDRGFVPRESEISEVGTMHWILNRLSPMLRRTYRRITTPPPPNLIGDRDVENSWIAANLPEGPGRVLDVGAGATPLKLIAAMKGFEVIALDLLEISLPYVHSGIEQVCGDILRVNLPEGRFDVLVCCSTIEHIGLAGNYEVENSLPDGDLKAMEILREHVAGNGLMVMTIPVGEDAVIAPLHRIYGKTRLPRLLEGWSIGRENFWIKNGSNRWIRTDRDSALSVEGNDHYYGLGLFVLRPA